MWVIMYEYQNLYLGNLWGFSLYYRSVIAFTENIYQESSPLLFQHSFLLSVMLKRILISYNYFFTPENQILCSI